MEISHIAGDVNGRNLALAIRILTETTNKACDDQAGVINPLSMRNEVPICLHMLSAPREIENCLLLLFREHRAAGQSV
jgi:hypothetical protein